MKEAITRTPSGSALTSFVASVFRLNGTLLAFGDRLVKDLGLTSARWQVLGVIDQDEATVSQIARRMGLARQGVQRIANDLLRRGFVRKKANPDHARAMLYILTPKGREVMRRVRDRQSVWANRAAEVLGHERIQEAGRLLAEATALLEQEDVATCIDQAGEEDEEGICTAV